MALKGKAMRRHMFGIRVGDTVALLGFCRDRTAAIAMAALLTACGGGAGTESATQTVDDQKMAQSVVSTRVAVPAPWVARKPAVATRPASGVITRALGETDIVHGEVTRTQHVRGEIVVELRSPAHWNSFATFVAAKGWPIVFYDQTAQLYTLKTSAATEEALRALVAEVTHRSEVLAATLNLVLTLGPQAASADPSWNQSDQRWNLETIKLPEARRALAAITAQPPGFGVAVSIIDGDFSDTHEDLAFAQIFRLGVYKTPQFFGGVRGNVAEAYDDPNHGMHVAGILAARENSVGLLGVAAGSTLWATNPYGSGIFTLDTLKSTLASHLGPSRVVNLSAGWGYCPKRQCQVGLGELQGTAYSFTIDFLRFMSGVLDRAPNRGILFVQSSGNYGDLTVPGSNVMHGAELNGYFSTAIAMKTDWTDMQQRLADMVLVVGAHDRNRNVTTYSMVPSGSDREYSGLLAESFILAPGGTESVGIYSALMPGRQAAPSYGFLYGTSMAAPHVSGVAAMLMHANNDLTAAQVKRIILSTADNRAGTRWNSGDGYKYLNAHAAVQEALRLKAQPGNGLGLSQDVTISVQGGWNWPTGLSVCGAGWGTAGAGTSKALLQFDHSAVPRSASAVFLNMYLTQGDDGYDAIVDIYRNSVRWSEASVGWDNRPAVVGAPVSFASSAAHSYNRWVQVDITRWVKDWQAGIDPNYGLTLDGVSSPLSGCRAFSSSEATSNKPYISWQ